MPVNLKSWAIGTVFYKNVVYNNQKKRGLDLND